MAKIDCFIKNFPLKQAAIDMFTWDYLSFSEFILPELREFASKALDDGFLWVEYYEGSISFNDCVKDTRLFAFFKEQSAEVRVFVQSYREEEDQEITPLNWTGTDNQVKLATLIWGMGVSLIGKRMRIRDLLPRINEDYLV